MTRKSTPVANPNSHREMLDQHGLNSSCPAFRSFPLLLSSTSLVSGGASLSDRKRRGMPYRRPSRTTVGTPERELNQE